MVIRRQQEKINEGCATRHALQGVVTIPNDAILIDDLLENVFGADSLGINAFHFTSADELLAEFSRLGFWES